MLVRRRPTSDSTITQLSSSYWLQFAVPTHLARSSREISPGGARSVTASAVSTEIERLARSVEACRADGVRQAAVATTESAYRDAIL
jgi:hypothetical protein